MNIMFSDRGCPLPNHARFGLRAWRRWPGASAGRNGLRQVLIGGLLLGCTAAWAHDWPMWGYDAGRMGRAPVELGAELHLNWTRQLPAPQSAWPLQFDDVGKLDFDRAYAPVVMGDKMFVCSMTTDSLTAYRIDTGAEVWRFYAGGPMRLAPAAWNGALYAVSDDGRLYCVDAETGALRWSYNAAPGDLLALGNKRVISMWPARGGPVVMDGKVYFAAGVWPMMGTMIFALDAVTGGEIWANTGEYANWQRQPHGGAFSFAGIAPQGYLAAAGDRLVVSGGRSLPAVLDRHTGKIVFLDIFGKGPGGYHVMADAGSYYHSGQQYSLRDGSSMDRAPARLDPALLARAEILMESLEGDIYTVLAARERLLVATLCGRIYCFGPAPAPAVEHAYAPDMPALRDDAAGRQAAAIVEHTGRHAGYALFLGVADGALIEQLALRTDMHIVGIDDDHDRIAALRRQFDAAGLYGRRIALLHADPATANYPAYISSLVVVPDPPAAGLPAAPEALNRVFGMLRPYGGRALLAFDAAGQGTALRQVLPENGRLSAWENWVMLERPGPLPGAGQWTHQYADAAHSAVSRDERVRLPLGVLWYGAESHDHVLPRHASGPRPQVAGGRLVILGVEYISARDVYTGRELWVREFPGIGHPFTNLELEAQWDDGRNVYMSNIPGAAYIGSPYVTLPDSIYLRHHGRIHRLDPDTGATLAVFVLPSETGQPDADWGYVGVSGDLLFATVNPHIFDAKRLGELNWNAISSEALTVMDRMTGQVLWTRKADVGFRHNAIAAADGMLFVVDGLSEKALEFMARRGAEPQRPARLLALDAQSGRVLWETDEHVFGTFLSYISDQDILLEGGAHGFKGGVLEDEPHGRGLGPLTARRGRTGEILWGPESVGHGPRLLVDDQIIPARPGGVRDLMTGALSKIAHPLTGEEVDREYWKSYGCGPANASPHLLLFRSGAAGFADLEHGAGTGNFGGFKSGCTASMIAADGILNAPDYTRTCRCSYQNQTSLGLVHMPQADLWTAVRAERGSEPIRRLGINLGAPGNRRADDGTLWVPLPDGGAPTPALKMTLETYDFAPFPVFIRSAQASSATGTAAQTLDGDSFTGWSVSTHRTRGDWDAWISYRLSNPVPVGRVSLDWETPPDSHFEIHLSSDGREWISVYEGRHSGNSQGFASYTFDDTVTAHIRVYLHAPGEKKGGAVALIRHARIGALPYPEAYAAFIPPQGIFRVHPLLTDGGESYNWVAASGVRGLKSVALDDIGGGGRNYTLRLHFVEPDDVAEGQRVFDVLLQGQTVMEKLDVIRQAGARRRGWVHTLPNVTLDDRLLLELRAVKPAALPPVLAGLEIIAE